jgi:hypothetical protein
MTTLPFNYTTFAAAALGFHTMQALEKPSDFIQALDDNAGGHLDLLAQFTIDRAMDSDDYDPLLELFFDDDEMTDDDWELIGRWLRDDITDLLTDQYKKLEPQLRLIHDQKTPSIDDI